MINTADAQVQAFSEQIRSQHPVPLDTAHLPERLQQVLNVRQSRESIYRDFLAQINELRAQHQLDLQYSQAEHDRSTRQLHEQIRSQDLIIVELERTIELLEDRLQDHQPNVEMHRQIEELERQLRDSLQQASAAENRCKLLENDLSPFLYSF